MGQSYTRNPIELHLFFCLFALVVGCSNSKAAKFEFQYEQFEASTYIGHTLVEGPEVVCNIKMSGDVKSGDLEALKSIIVRMPQNDNQRGFYPRTRLCLDSAGGSYEEALKIAEFLLQGGGVGTATVPNGECLSACAIIFIAGANIGGEDNSVSPDRYLHVSSRLGFHAPYLKEGGPEYDKTTLDTAMLAGIRAVAKLLKITSAAGDHFISQSLLYEMMERGPNEAFFIDTVGKAVKYKILLYGYVGKADLGEPTVQMLCFASRYAFGLVEWQGDGCEGARVTERVSKPEGIDFKISGAVMVEDHSLDCSVTLWSRRVGSLLGSARCGSGELGLEALHFYAPGASISRWASRREKEALIIAPEVREQPSNEAAAAADTMVKTYENHDLSAVDYYKLPDSSLSTCATSCETDKQCRAYTYDKWNRWCFLKSSVGTLRLDPQSVSGVKKGDGEPARSRAPADMERYRGKAFPYAGQSTSSAASLEDCEKRCQSAPSCLGITFFTSSKQCRLMEDLGEYFSDPKADSSVKRQSLRAR